MTASATPNAFTRKQRQRRRLLLVGGFTVPAAVLGGVFVALPANAAGITVNDKQALTDAVDAATGTALITLGDSLTADDVANDVQTINDGASVTIDLDGNTLDLDQVVIGAGSHLFIQDTSTSKGKLILDAESTEASGVTLDDGAVLDIDGAHVDSTGTLGRAGIGAASTTNTVRPAVLIEDGAKVSATGGSSAAGIGGTDLTVKGASTLTAANGTTSNASPASAIGGGDGSDDFGTVTVGAGATLNLPAGSTLRIPADKTVTNNGTINLNGTATGAGMIANNGTLVPTPNTTVGVGVTGNNFAVTLATAGGADSSIPTSAQQVYAPTFAALKDYKPTKDGAYFTGWQAAGGKAVAFDTALATTLGGATGGSAKAVTLTAQYSAPIAVTDDKHLYVAKSTTAIDQALPLSGNAIAVTLKSGSVPAGLRLTSAGHLTGTPTTNGLSSFTVTVKSANVDEPTQDFAFQVSVGAKPAITTTGELPLVTLGTSYSADVASTGNGTVSLTADGLPTGLSMDTAGHISGTTAGAEAETPITVTASSEFGTAKAAYTLHIGQVPVISPSPLHAVTIGEKYSQPIAVDGKGSPTLSIDPSTPLPTGLDLVDGAIVGTYDGEPDSVDVTVKAHSSYGDSSQSFTLALGVKPSISTKSLPAITIDAPYAARLTTGGDGTKTFELAAGQVLPGTLKLDKDTGAISGTYSGTAKSFTFIVDVTSEFGTSDPVTYAVEAAEATSITNDVTTTVKLGKPFTLQIALDGGTTHAAYSIEDGSALPAGLSLDEKTGLIRGTATGDAGPVDFTVVVQTDFGPAVTKTIRANVGSVPSFAKDRSIDTAIIGKGYTQQLPATGTDAEYTVTKGALPSWVTLSKSGELSGDTPVAGTWTFTVTAHSIYGDASQEFTLLGGSAPALKTVRIPQATVGGYYEASLISTGDGDATYSITGSNTLPSGLSLDEQTGVISGSVRTADDYSFDVTVSTAFGTATRTYALSAGAAPVLSASTDLPPVTVGEDYTFSVPTGGDDVVGYTVTSGTLPGTLTLDPNTGVLAGAVDGESRTTIEVTASSKFGTTRHTYTLTAGFAPKVSTVSDDLGAITVGSDYSKSIVAKGTGATKYVVVDPTELPAGLTLSTDGTLFGKATAAKSFTFDVKASNAFGSDVRSYTVLTGKAPAFSTVALPDATVGTAYRTPIDTTGDGTLTLKLTKGELPKGLTFDAKTGVLSGTPTADGTAKVELTASSVYGTTSSELSIAVKARPAEPVKTPEPVKTTAPEPVKTTTPEPVKTTPPAPVATAPVLPSVPKATVKLGQSYSLSVAASSTVDVTYALQGRLPAGLALNSRSGVITGSPKASGTFAFSVKASSSAGADVEKYTIVVPEQSSVIAATSSRVTPTMDRPFNVTISGLRKGERWRVQIGTKTIATGNAAKAGSVTAHIELPVTKKDASYTLHVTGNRSITDASKKAATDVTVTAIVVKKALKVQGSAEAVTVRNLAPREAVTVTEKGRTIVTGRADAKGVFTFTPTSLKTGKHTLVAQGVLKNRAGTGVVKISR